MPAFKTIHTTTGLQRLAAAEATGTPVSLSQMAVGDGNGNPVLPAESQTALVRELFRAAVNRVFQDPVNPKKFTAELVVPAATGGFTLREVGLFDSSGNLFVVGNLPETYKPAITDGSYADTVVRVEFLVDNASAVTIVVDPNVAVATQSWIANNVTAATIIPGGTTGQLLAKVSNVDGATHWVDPDAVNVVVDVIEEPQTLAGGQTEVILGTCTTHGLAVYINGARIDRGPAANQWQPKPATPETVVLLGQAYAAGTHFLGVQNEPAGAAPFPLVRNQNLADVADAATARTNLGVYSKAESDTKAPAGLVASFAGSAAPNGWLKANGAPISRTAYAALFAAIGITYGAGDGFTTFNLPDLRGEFIRGWDDGRGIDPGRVFGTLQAGAFASHAHAGSTDAAAAHTHTGYTDAQGSHAHNGSTDTQGSHAHSGSTDTQGSHVHGVSDPGHQHPYQASLTTTPGGAEGGSRDSAGTTNLFTGASLTGISLFPAGDHAHGLTAYPSGDHAHGLTTTAVGPHAHNVTTAAAGGHSHNVTTTAIGGTETRPRNIALLYCIKY